MLMVLTKSKTSKSTFIDFRMENDVQLLRNRVRMLQMEHEKAKKKI
jgi:hypothetical protein